MADNLLQDCFAGKRDAAWHNKGTVFHDDPSAVEAFGRANALFDYIEEPLYYILNGVQTQSRMKMILRAPIGKETAPVEMDVVENGYHLIQNMTIAETLDAKIFDGKSLVEMWPVETVGLLDNGRVLFATLRETPYHVKGDRSQIDRFFMISDGKDGGKALRISVVHRRVVCENTMTMALNGASTDVSLAHHKGVLADFHLFTQAIAQMEQSQAGVTQLIQRMAETRIDDEIAKRLIAQVFPEPTQPNKARILGTFKASDLKPLTADAQAAYEKAQAKYERDREKMAIFRKVSFDRYVVMNDAEPGCARTAYVIPQAISEVLDRAPGRGDVTYNIMFGDRSRSRNLAFKLAADLVKAN